MIVDCHTHLNFDKEEIATAEYLAVCETVGACIVLAGYNNEKVDNNKKLSEYLLKQNTNKIIGFASIDPTLQPVGTSGLTGLTEKLGLSGIVVYCSACSFHPCHSRAMRLYQAAEELGLPVFFHNSGHLKSNAVLDYAQPYLLDEIARTFSGLKMIIGSMGRPFYEQTLAMIAKHKNVYADLTIKSTSLWQIYNIVIQAHEQSLMEKLLFGSGFPETNPSQCIETLLGLNKQFGDTNLPAVPIGSIRNTIERDTLGILGLSLPDKS
ncbi:MAG: amidohydrolase family protein [Planctomycetes bacterium]|nr:amidohydrolase family protein [Planctomycetota bacterium]MBL7107014.1 amidohydrolase family protein [Phycisphaerae bacterium]